MKKLSKKNLTTLTIRYVPYKYVEYHDIDYCCDYQQTRPKVFRPASATAWSNKEIAKEGEEMLRQLQELALEDNESDQEMEQKKSDDVDNTVCHQ